MLTHRLAGWTLVACLVLAAISFVAKKQVPNGAILPALDQEPAQAEVSELPFTVRREGFLYTISPQYSYEFWGLIVSEVANNTPLEAMRKTHPDPLMVKDICAVWGPNIRTGAYKAYKYVNQSTFCAYQTKPRANLALAKQFTHTHLSNNHLFPKNAEVERAIKKSKPGDQIHFKGCLINFDYAGPNGEQGGGASSITRDDVYSQSAMNTTCEIVFVEEFEILKRGNPLFFGLFRVFFSLGLLAFLVYLFTKPKDPLHKTLNLRAVPPTPPGSTV